jgi:hypothetical protein
MNPKEILLTSIAFLGSIRLYFYLHTWEEIAIHVLNLCLVILGIAFIGGILWAIIAGFFALLSNLFSSSPEVSYGGHTAAYSAESPRKYDDTPTDKTVLKVGEGIRENILAYALFYSRTKTKEKKICLDISNVNTHLNNIAKQFNVSPLLIVEILKSNPDDFHVIENFAFDIRSWERSEILKSINTDPTVSQHSLNTNSTLNKNPPTQSKKTSTPTQQKTTGVKS